MQKGRKRPHVDSLRLAVAPSPIGQIPVMSPSPSPSPGVGGGGMANGNGNGTAAVTTTTTTNTGGGNEVRSKRLVCVTPWHMEGRASPIAYQILDSELVPLLQSIVRKVYILIGQRHTHLPLLDLEFAHLQSLMWAQSHLPTYRTAVVQNALKVMQNYHLSANGQSGKRMAIQEGPAAAMALHTNPCVYHAWPAMEFFLRPRMDSLSAEAQGEYRFSERQMHSNMPFTLPVSLMAADSIEFYRGYNQYIHTFKEDGIRMLWIFCTVGKTRLCFWMDRKGTCYWIPASNAPAAFYKGTIFDGELVKTKDGLSYGIFDMLWKCGRSTGEYPASTRLQQIYIGLDEWNAHTGTPDSGEHYDRDLFTNSHRVHPQLVARSKRFFMTQDVATMYRIMSRGHAACDGVIHITDESPIVVGTCAEWRKSKMSHPLDFRADLLHEGKDGCWFRLFCYDTCTKRYISWTRFGDLYVADTQAARLRLPHVRMLHRQIVECKLVPLRPLHVLDAKTDDQLDASDLRYDIIHIRFEKIRTNDIETVQRTPLRGPRISRIFPPSYFDQFERLWTSPSEPVPPSTRVLEAIDRQGLNWDRPCPASDSILLPPITPFSITPMATLKRDYVIKCSSWSKENYAETMKAHSKT